MAEVKCYPIAIPTDEAWEGRELLVQQVKRMQEEIPEYVAMTFGPGIQVLLFTKPEVRSRAMTYLQGFPHAVPMMNVVFVDEAYIKER